MSAVGQVRTFKPQTNSLQSGRSQPAVTATDRTIAARKSPRLSRDRNSDRTAVAGPCEHGNRPSCVA
jgi:hypothetical protein